MPEVPLVMPKMSMTMETGEVVGWRVSVGDTIAAGDVVCEVLTDKVDMEVESPVGGTVARIVAGAQETVPVGQPLAFIATDSDELLAGLLDSPTDPAAPPPPPPPAEATTAAPPTPGAEVGEARSADAGAVPVATSPSAGLAPEAVRAVPPSRKGAVPALPGARRKAAELGVRLDGLVGSGPGGAIAVVDVERAAAGRSPAPRPAPVDPEVFGTDLTPVLRAALEATRGALAPVENGTPPPPTAAPATATPHGDGTSPTVATAPPEAAAPAKAAEAAEPAAGSAVHPPGTADATPTNGAGGGVNPGFADVLAARRRSVRAAVNRAMEKSAAIPQFTVFADLDLTALGAARGRIGWTALLTRAFARALRDAPNLNGDAGHVGVALAADTPVGLLAPVVRDPDRMPVADLDAAIRATVEKARNGRLSAEDLAGATVTVSNLGGWPVQAFSALLTPPQAAVLSVGAIEPRPAVGPDGGLTIRTTCTVGLTVDHRAADGADAARLLAAIRRHVADPPTLLS
ncbi:MAG TPA: 2-oxo acid dehydrogenase subunit E2 [Mycobacteriales bacterium]